MATNMTQESVVAEARAWQQRINLIVKAITELRSQIKRNAHMSIDWGNGDLYAGGGDISTDAAGNINGLTFTPAQLSNAIGSLDWMRKFFDNESLAGIGQADHLGNLNLVASPEVLRPDRV